MATKKRDGSKAPAKRQAKSKVSKAGGAIYQVKITLDDVKPPIWRRVETRDCSLARLHDIIQASMGWSDGHLHVFEIGGEQYGLPEQWQEGGWGEPEVDDSSKLKLSQLAAGSIKKFRYVYDMGDSWQHTIQIEKIIEAEPGAHYPRCIKGARACPPEDCGGAWGYGDLLEAISNPKHPQHEEMKEWLEGEFDPEEFNLDRINQDLA